MQMNNFFFFQYSNQDFDECLYSMNYTDVSVIVLCTILGFYSLLILLYYVQNSTKLFLASMEIVYTIS